MGYANINDVFGPWVLKEVGDMLEDHGYEACLYQNTSVRLGTNVGKPVAEGYPSPDVFLHFRIAAYICGMGEIGWSKVFLTPRFGPRQRFAFIITDAPLRPDPLVEPGTLCDRDRRRDSDGFHLDSTRLLPCARDERQGGDGKHVETIGTSGGGGLPGACGVVPPRGRVASSGGAVC